MPVAASTGQLWIVMNRWVKLQQLPGLTLEPGLATILDESRSCMAPLRCPAASLTAAWPHWTAVKLAVHGKLSMRGTLGG